VPKRIRKRARPARARDYYQPTPIPGLLLYPTVLLLNLIVRTAEDNGKTDGRIPAETVDVVTALIRNTYDSPDLDLARGKGVVMSFIGQFFHPTTTKSIASPRCTGGVSSLSASPARGLNWTGCGVTFRPSS
jgi:hypothetical protein